MDKILKLAALNVGIAVLNVIIFSAGLLHIKIGGASVLASAFGVTVILMSGVIFVFGNYRLLFQKEKLIHTAEIKSADDCVAALEQSYDKKTFVREISVLLEQIKRFRKKKETINDILLQKFSSTEMSFSKFQGAILNVEEVFYLNIKSVLNKLNAFDEDDYEHIKKENAGQNFSREFIETKMSIYNEYIKFVKDAIEENEQILLKLDKVLLEISKFNSLEDGEIENMSAMKEIDELINNTKWYK